MVLEIFWSQGSIALIIMRNTEKGDNSVIDCENFTKIWSGHLHFRHNLWYKFHDPSWSGSWDILFTRFHCAVMRNTEKGDNSVMDCENFTKSWSGHLHFRHNLWYKFHDPSWSGSWDILFTRFHCVIMRNTEKGGNSVMDCENFTKS